MQKHHESISREEAIWVLADMCRKYRRPFDPLLFLAHHPIGGNGSYTLGDLVLLLAEALGSPPSTILCRDRDSPFHGRWPAWHCGRRPPVSLVRSAG